MNIIYCRVSNLKLESQSFSTQEKNCTEYCKKNNLRIKAIHKEHNSGYGKQKNLDSIIKNHKNINLIINDITRFSRSHQYGNKLLNVCLKKNIVLHFVKENIILDPETNFHLVQAGLENSEHQWTTIRNNIIANIKYRKAQGLCLGNAPFGFNVIDKKLVKNENFNVIRLIVALRNSVKNCSEIRKILQKLSSDSISLKFYEKYYENWIEKEREIQHFTSAFTLDFKTIAIILNDYKVCNKHWVASRVEEIYKRNCLDIEFKEETEYASKYSTDVGTIRRFMNDLSILNNTMQEN